MPTVPLLASVADLSASQIAGAASQLVPSGVVMPYAGSAAPSGWLICDGTAVSRTTYGNLYAALGSAASPYGQGDGSTTFNLPDTRGIFISGSGSQTISSIIYSRTHGTKQGDLVQGHHHVAAGNVAWGTSSTGGASYPFALYVNANAVAGEKAQNAGPVGTGSYNPSNDGTNGNPRTGTETRPANIAMNYIIKI